MFGIPVRFMTISEWSGRDPSRAYGAKFIEGPYSVGLYHRYRCHCFPGAVRDYSMERESPVAVLMAVAALGFQIFVERELATY